MTDIQRPRLDKVMCAPDSFKETLSAAEAAAAMAAGVARAGSVASDLCPLADGGEGSLEVLTGALGGSLHEATVTGPLGEPVRARFGVAGTTGIVELAEASGLELVEPRLRDPERTTTFGTGELIAAAAARGCDTVLVCIGGSATADGGAGAVQALGGAFVDAEGGAITEPLTGATLGRIAGCSPPASVPRLRVACDVTNPLLGPEGAAAVYAPQKGATPSQVERLELALAHFAKLAGSDPDRPGAGAAGGAGYGLAALAGATLERGIDLVLEVVGFQRRARDAGLVLTGEGSLDEQTRRGKVCFGVASAAEALGVPVIAIVGRTAAETGNWPFAEIVSLADRYGLHRAMTETAALLEDAAADVMGRWV